jgi:glycosyltransferase involved in cell wall biosynthesis
VADDVRARLGVEAHLVPNGWDPDSLAEDRAPSEVRDLLDPDRASIVYTGRFGSYGRDPTPLVNAMAELADRDPASAERLELVVAGPLTDAEAELMRHDVAPARIVTVGTIPREQALALQRAADALLLVASPRRSQLLNFKLFEYLAAGRPIVALAAGTEAGRVVSELGGETAPADDVPAIVRALHMVAQGDLETPDPAAVDAYSYPATAERMAQALDAAIARRSAHRALSFDRDGDSSNPEAERRGTR